MSVNNHGRRLDALAQSLHPDCLPETLRLAERMAADRGISRDEVIAETRRLIQEAGPPYTAEHIVRHIEKHEGIPASEILANAAELEARYAS